MSVGPPLPCRGLRRGSRPVRLPVGSPASVQPAALRIRLKPPEETVPPQSAPEPALLPERIVSWTEVDAPQASQL